MKVRLLPTEAEAAALTATLQACNGAASWLSGEMHAKRVFRKYEAQKRFYTELRSRFGLSAQPAIRVIGKVADAYAALRANIAAGNYGHPDRRAANAWSQRRLAFALTRAPSFLQPEQIGL